MGVFYEEQVFLTVNHVFEKLHQKHNRPLNVLCASLRCLMTSIFFVETFSGFYLRVSVRFPLFREGPVDFNIVIWNTILSAATELSLKLKNLNQVKKLNLMNPSLLKIFCLNYLLQCCHSFGHILYLVMYPVRELQLDNCCNKLLIQSFCWCCYPQLKT